MFEFEQLFKRTDAVQRHLAAPLLRSRLAYLGHRAEQGAKPSTLRGIAAFQVQAIHYLELVEEGQITPSDIATAAERWVTQHPARRGGNVSNARRDFVSRVSGWLSFAGRMQVPSVASRMQVSSVASRMQVSSVAPPLHCPALVQFEDYMRWERGWSEVTIRYRLGRAEDLLRRCCRAHQTLADLSLTTIDRALGARNSKDGCPRARATIRNHADALRAFLRFAAVRGWCPPGLATAITAPRVYKAVTLPAGPSPEDLRRLLATTTGDRPADVRDRALLLTLSVYGLRAGEAQALRLDDINWEAESVRVRRPKTGRTTGFPLSHRVGEALARYLREVRPQTDSRQIFLTLKPPVRPLGVSTISSVVRSRMRRCGIECERRGAHALRHAFARALAGRGLLHDRNRGLPRAPQSGSNRGIRKSRPYRPAPSGGRLRSGGTGMMLREAIDQYIVWQRARGASFESSAYALRRFRRSVGSAIGSDARSAPTRLAPSWTRARPPPATGRFCTPH